MEDCCCLTLMLRVMRFVLVLGLLRSSIVLSHISDNVCPVVHLLGATNISCCLPSSFSRFAGHSNASSVSTDGTEISKCCSRNESADPMLGGANNGFLSRVNNIFRMLDDRYQPIEEQWLSLSSVHSSPADGDIDASDLINRDATVDAVESASLYSDTYHPVEEPWLVYPAVKSVNADVGFKCEASTREQSPNDGQNLTSYQEHALQFPEKRPDQELIKHHFLKEY